MSGGSFNYLYCAAFVGVDKILQQKWNLMDMIDSAKSDNKYEFAEQLEHLLRIIENFERNITDKWGKLEHCMKAYEWWRSGDWSEETFDTTWNDFYEEMIK